MAKKKPNRHRKPRTKSAKSGEVAPATAAAQADTATPKVGPVKYVGQVRQEARKVVWPTQRETVVTSILVLIMVVLMGVFFFFTDSIISWVVDFIINLGKTG